MANQCNYQENPLAFRIQGEKPSVYDCLEQRIMTRYKRQHYRSILSHKQMREPDVNEVADYLELPVEKVENHIKYMNHANLLSFESVLQDMTAIVAKGELESGDIEGKPEENLFYKELMGTLTSAIDGLGEKERLVITLYYYEELKYSEIAQVMGIGQSRVCQIHTRAIQKLKASLEDYMRG